MRLAIVTVEGVFTCSEEEVKESGARFSMRGEKLVADNLEAELLHEWAAIVVRDEAEDQRKLMAWVKGGCKGIPAGVQA